MANNDPADFAPLGEAFDVVLVDAPCSGEGMFRKDAGAVDDWSLENVAMCARRQRRILADIWPCLKPGGLLIYSTCTYNLSEDEEQVRWLRDEWGALPVEVSVPVEWCVTGCLLPGEDDAPASSGLRRKKGRGGNGRDRVPPLSKEMMQRAAAWLREPERYALSAHGSGIFAFPSLYKDVLERLRSGLRLLQAGVPLAEAKGRDLLPVHALAMSTAMRPDVR